MCPSCFSEAASPLIVITLVMYCTRLKSLSGIWDNNWHSQIILVVLDLVIVLLHLKVANAYSVHSSAITDNPPKNIYMQVI